MQFTISDEMHSEVSRENSLMTQAELEIYKTATGAAVYDDRKGIARALHRAKKYKKSSTRYGEIPLQKYILWQCNFIGWPVRLRPNGRYI